MQYTQLTVEPMCDTAGNSGRRLKMRHWFHSALRIGLIGVLALGSAAVRANEPAPAEAAPGGGAYTEDDLFRFLEDEIEVTTASRLKTKLSEVPQAVYVLTREEIKRLNASNLADLLRHVPGLIVANPSPAQWTVGVEAPTTISTGLVLVLVDGRAIYTPFLVHQRVVADPVLAGGPRASRGGAGAIEHHSRLTSCLRSGQLHHPRCERGGAQFRGGGRWQLRRRSGRALRGCAQPRRRHDSPRSGPGVRVAGGYDRLTPWDDAAFYQDGRLVPTPDAQRGYGNLRAEIDLGEDTTLTLLAGGSGHEAPYYSYGPGLAFGADAHADAELALRRLFGDEDQLSLRAYYRVKRFYTEGPLDTLLPTADFDHGRARQPDARPLQHTAARS